MPNLPYQLTVTADQNGILTAQDPEGRELTLVRIQGGKEQLARDLLNELLTQPAKPTS
ncbi:hypothetical protein M0Q28_00435 [Patescibacteria group bacterium]|jgi:hypothetical protein|nr:hypothetical protein [Patescibacteria group bacterium]